MRRYGMLLLVLVLAVTSLLAAAAYNTATVTNAASMKVVNTNAALLALNVDNAKVGNKDHTAWIEDGVLHFDFSRGKGEHPAWLPVGHQRGFQRGSTYTWNSLFSIKNQSNDAIEYTIEVSGGLKYITIATTKIAGAGVYLKFVDNGTNLYQAAGAASGDTAEIGVSFTIPADADLEDLVGTITVKARAVASAWRHGLVAW